MEDKESYLEEMRRYLEAQQGTVAPETEIILKDAVRQVWEEIGKELSSFEELEQGVLIKPLNKGFSITILEESDGTHLSLGGLRYPQFYEAEVILDVVRLSLLGKFKLIIRIDQLKKTYASKLVFRSGQGGFAYEVISCLSDILSWWFKKTEIEVFYIQ